MSQTAAETLAAHYEALSLSDIPAADLDSCKTLLRDYLGVALGGSQSDSGAIAIGFAAEMGGREEATLIGHGGRVPAVHAAFANAIASHSLELDDVDILALYHFSPPVVSAAFAVAERQNSSGAALMTAIVAGCEMMARVSNAANISLRNRGIHTTPACGVFGAAIAAGKLLGLTADQYVSALGLAGAQASGLMEMYGPSMQKRFNPGPAARGGVTAAIMAQMGYTGAATIFEGERGFLRAFTDTFDVDALTADLGKDFKFEMEYKAYSCARPIHNAIDCALDLRARLDAPTSAIRSMRMARHPDWAHFHLNKTPQTYHEAQVSLPYSVAVALVEGAALPPQYQEDKLNDPELRRLSDLIEVVPDPSLPRGVSCRLQVETGDGRRFEAQVDHPRGSIENPMSRDEMIGKLHMLADPAIGAERVDRLVAEIDAIENLATVAGLAALLRPPA